MSELAAETIAAELQERMVRFELHDPELAGDPHPLYAQLRARCPVSHSDQHGGHYVVACYDDVLAILQNPSEFSSTGVLIPDWPFPVGGARQIPLEIDGDDHRLYRLALANMFSPARINQLEPRMRETARRLLGELKSAGGGEMMAGFASPLAAETFLHTFDLPASVIPDLVEFKDLLIRGGGESRDQLAADSPKIVGLFADLLERRRAEGGGGADVMSELLRARFGERSLTDDEIINISVVLMLASLDTTSNALGNMLAFLVDHPEHRKQLLEDESLIPNAIEEMLRYEGMISNGRLVTAPTELHGIELVEGDRVMLLYASAGRDEKMYERPDQVDFHRQGIRHLAFGAGPHRCLGMHLARRTLKVALEELHRTAANYRLAPGTSPQRALGHVRGVLSLHFLL